MADPVVVSSTIDAVQVFRRGAVVLRRAVLEGDVLAGGCPATIELAGLPLSLTDPTARVRVLSVEPASASVSATGLQIGIHVRPGLPPEPPPEQQAIDDLERRIAELGELVRVLDNEIGLLSGIPVPDRPDPEEGRAPPPAPLAMRLALESFVDDAAEARRLERRTIAATIRGLREELAALHERARASSTAANVKQGDLSKSAIVPLRVEGIPTKVVIEVRYIIPGARWAPAYHVKLARDGSSAVVHQRAHIAQCSGEDWSGVKLQLSTAMPLRYSELPELASIRIGKAQPPPTKRGFRPPPKGGQELFADVDRDRARVLAAVPALAPWSPPVFEAGSLSFGAISAGAGAGAAQGLSSPSRKKGGVGKTASIDTGALRAASDMAMDDDDSLMDMELDESPSEMMAEESYARAPMMEKSARAMPAMRSAPPPPPAPSAPSRSRRAAAVGGPPAPGVDDVVDAIVFPLLRLPSAWEPARGRLIPVDTRRLYAESAARFGRPLPFDVADLVYAADAAAMNAGGPVPAMCMDLGEIVSNFDFAYDADGVVDVVADGAWHSVPLGDRECDASVRYVTVPREELAVYRIAVIQNSLGSPMLAGPAEIYVGGEYVLTTALPTVTAKGELTLGLGVEQSIKVARNARFKEVRDGEGVVAMVELVHDVDIDVVNHLGRTIAIEVRERVPTPEGGAEVQVSERNVEPAWESYDQEERGQLVEGGRRWSITVAAGASQVLKASYVLRLFSNSEVTGGNRRES